MALQLEIHLANKAKYTLLVIGFLFVLSMGAFAYTSALPDPGHGADAVMVSVGGQEMTLQKAIDDSFFTEKPTEIDYSECVTKRGQCRDELQCPANHAIVEFTVGSPCGFHDHTNVIKCCELVYPR